MPFTLSLVFLKLKLSHSVPKCSFLIVYPGWGLALPELSPVFFFLISFLDNSDLVPSSIVSSIPPLLSF